MQVNNNSISLASLDAMKSQLSELKTELGDLQSNISNIHEKNYINDNEIKSTTRELSNLMPSIKKLESISSTHGNDVIVRLKGDVFKPGKSDNLFNNIFNGGRYKSERKAAAEKVSASQSEVSASTLISSFTKKIEIGNKTLKAINQETANSDKKLSGYQTQEGELKNKIHRLGHHIEELKLQEYQLKEPSRNNENNAPKAISRTETVVTRSKENIETIKNLSVLYQSNAGAHAITRSKKLDPEKVIEEYKRALGDDIFNGGNKNLKNKIEVLCDDLPTLVKNAANVFYTPRNENITTYRGQGMTTDGLSQLVDQYNLDKEGDKKTVYEIGQFASTSRDKSVATGFAEDSRDEKQVMFIIKGNSSNGLLVTGGLKFGNEEKEKLYSPLAQFQVTKITVNKETNFFNIRLNEVPRVENAVPMPY